MALRSWSVLFAALLALLLSLLLAPPRAAAQDPARFDVLVFSKTTGFRHESAIAAGRTGIQALGTAGGYAVTLSEDAAVFSDAGLRDYEVVVFLHTDGEGILNAAQRTAFERWTSRGGGIVSIHADANADRNWAWKTDMMGGALFANHPGRRAPVPERDRPRRGRGSPRHAGDSRRVGAQRRVVQLHRRAAREGPRPRHARREHLRGAGRVGRGRRPPDRVVLELRRRPALLHRARARGRALAGAAVPHPHRRRDRVGVRRGRGRLRRAARGPADRRLLRQGHARRHDREPDGDRRRARRHRLHGRAGRPVKRYNPANGSVRRRRHDPGAPRQRERPARHRARSELRDEPLALPLLQRADPGGAARLALHVAAGRHDRHGVREGAADDPAPARDLLPLLGLAGVRARRQPLHLHRRRHASTRRPGLRAARRPAALRGRLRQPDAEHAFDSRRSSGNTNDLRGKILRITPKDDGTYTVPAGNLFPRRSPATRRRRGRRSTRWATATRSGSHVDPETGWLYNGEVGPDANGDNAGRGPRGYDELNQIRSAGNMGWPFCIADNKPYVDWTSAERTARARRSTAPAGPTQRLRLEHRAGAGRRRPAGDALLALRPRRPTSRSPSDRAARPHGDRRPDVPLRREQHVRGQVPALVRRQGVLRRLVARLGGDARARRAGQPGDRRDHRVHAERRLPARPGHGVRARRRALRARVGPRLQLRRLGHQPRLRPVPDRVRARATARRGRRRAPTRTPARRR